MVIISIMSDQCDQVNTPWGKNLQTFTTTTILPAEATELDFLFMMMNSDIFQYIADETNRYAE